MFCYDEFSVAIFGSLQFGIFSPAVPALVYYSHFTAVIVSILLSVFILLNAKTLPARILMSISLVFALLATIDVLLWTQIDSGILMFLWSFWLFLFITIYVLSLYFLYTFISKKDVNFPVKLIATAILIGVLVLSASSLNLEAFDLYNCSAVEGLWTLNAVFGLSFLIFLTSLVYGFSGMRKLTVRAERRQALLVTIGVALFLLSFSAAAYFASIANLLGSEPDTFALEQYGYFGMAVFIALLAYVIVQYRAFNVGLLAAQALVVAQLVALVSVYTFARSLTNQVLIAVTLALTGILGTVLIRSVKREIEQRKHIEKLAQDLEKANERQVILIHFISHQIKGFVSKSRNIFAMMLEGDYGQLTPEMKPIVEEGFRSDTQGVNTIQDILNASNIKSGQVTYTMAPFDLKALIDEVAGNLRGGAEAKGLAFNVNTGNDPLIYTGDRGQLVNVFKNLIDNSIKYTQQGEVNVSLTKTDGAIRFEMRDTGIGITEEDMKHLFTEGGHGKESSKVNVESTGFGLYIVKNIVEAHKGKVWAESEGCDKGSRFVAELPV